MGFSDQDWRATAVTTRCSIPTNGIQWRKTRQPVVLGDWPVTAASDPFRFTTIASWRGSFGAVEHNGNKYGLKVHEFRKFVELPSRLDHIFEIALDIHAGDKRDLDLLHGQGWHTVKPRAVAADPHSFRKYVQDSGAEFSVAQGIYVETNSGWFSDRTVRYLASGKPVLVQNTGFGENLPIGNGLVGFRTMDEAIAGAESITADYARHSQAARHIAECYFNSDEVLGKLLDELQVAP
jgi:hypothetical protein